MRHILAALALLTVSPAYAAEVVPAGEKPAAEKPICHRDAPATGSTLPGKRVCKTAAEWKAQEIAQRREAGPAAMPTGMQQEPFTTR